jgi:methionine biosynthesis protein metW
MNEIVPFAHYDVLQCDMCGMMFAGNIVETMPLPVYYEQLSKYETAAYKALTESGDVRQGFVRLLLADVKPGDAVLEVGCGEGSLLHFLKEYGVQNLVGLEPSRKNCETIQRCWGIRAIPGALGEEIPQLAEQKFDVIILEGVLEHLLDVQENLKQALGYLAADGKICFVVPDLATFPEQNDFYQQFSVEHLNYFSMQSLTNLMRRFGMRCIRHGSAGEAFYTLWQRIDNAMTTPPLSCSSMRWARHPCDAILNSLRRRGQRSAKKLRPIKVSRSIFGAQGHTHRLFFSWVSRMVFASRQSSTPM